MELNIPGVEDVQAALKPLTLKQIDRLAELSGVPAPTIYKIRNGDTKNPGVETLRKFAPHIRAAGAQEPA